MGTESELKYKIESTDSGNAVLQSKFITQYKIKDSSQTLNMKAVYYDDSDLTLTSNKIGYRIRKENNQYVATVKYSGKHTKEGFSKRYEYNMNVENEVADPNIFKDIIDNKEVCSLLCNIKPVPMFTTEFTRKLLLIKYHDSIIEVAFDLGRIYTEDNLSRELSIDEIQIAKSVPISELECELKTGNDTDLLDFGTKLAKEFKIKPLNKSKLKRGMKLVQSTLNN